VNVHKIGLGDELVVPDFLKSIALVNTWPWRRIMYSTRSNSRGRRSIVRSPRLTLRVRRSSHSGPTLRTVSRRSADGRRSSSTLASNSAMAATLAGFTFIGSASVLGNRDDAERISHTLLLIIEFSFLRLTTARSSVETLD
jgi:hypothetical protein